MSESIEITTEEPVKEPVQKTVTINSIRELILPLKRPEDETFDDYKARRLTTSALIDFYLKNHYWPRAS